MSPLTSRTFIYKILCHYLHSWGKKGGGKGMLNDFYDTFSVSIHSMMKFLVMLCKCNEISIHQSQTSNKISHPSIPLLTVTDLWW